MWLAILQCWGSISIHRPPGKLHHLAPLLGLIGNQSAEFGRRHRFWETADGGELLDQLWILQRLADRLVEDVDDLRRRALGRRDDIKPDRLESPHGLGNRRDVGQAGPA